MHGVNGDCPCLIYFFADVINWQVYMKLTCWHYKKEHWLSQEVEHGARFSHFKRSEMSSYH
jgi:hypothetical protein